jgi:hypothetical protein
MLSAKGKIKTEQSKEGLLEEMRFKFHLKRTKMTAWLPWELHLSR